MELVKLSSTARNMDGTPIIEESYPVKSVRHAIDLAHGDLRNRPFYGAWRIIRSDGRWALPNDAANGLICGYPIEWHL